MWLLQLLLCIPTVCAGGCCGAALRNVRSQNRLVRLFRRRLDLDAEKSFDHQRPPTACCCEFLQLRHAVNMLPFKTTQGKSNACLHTALGTSNHIAFHVLLLCLFILRDRPPPGLWIISTLKSKHLLLIAKNVDNFDLPLSLKIAVIDGKHNKIEYDWKCYFYTFSTACSTSKSKNTIKLRICLESVTVCSLMI